MDEWPSCTAKVVAFGVELECFLPLHHEMDGHPRHGTAEGTQWWIEWEDELPHVHISSPPWAGQPLSTPRRFNDPA